MLRISRAARNIRDLLQRKPSESRLHTFWFEGDNVELDFALPVGWQPAMVFVDGSLMRIGELEDYTVKNDGFEFTISFAVAPAGVNIGVSSERVI